MHFRAVWEGGPRDLLERELFGRTCGQRGKERVMPQRATCIWGASCVSGVSGASGVSALCVQWNSEIHGNGAYQAYQAYQTYQLCARSGIMRPRGDGTYQAYQAYQAYRAYQLCVCIVLLRYMVMVQIRRIRRIRRISLARSAL